MMNFHSFTVNDIAGHAFDLALLKGKKVLVVNTASACGYTPQFGLLEELYEEFGDDGLVIMGFPSNDFGAQDPGTNDEIAAFCQMNYGVTFPMMEKIHVIGENTHPLYKWLKEQSKSEVKWNFHKFLIDEDGNVIKDFAHSVEPNSPEIVSLINIFPTT